jgi:preprotein translocase SecE subunit
MAEHSGRSGLFNTARESWRETLAEWRKIQWPTQAQAKNLTLVVLVVMTAMAVLLSMCDFIFGYLVEEIVAMNIIAIVVGILIIISINFIIFLSTRSR